MAKVGKTRCVYLSDEDWAYLERIGESIRDSDKPTITDEDKARVEYKGGMNRSFVIHFLVRDMVKRAGLVPVDVKESVLAWDTPTFFDSDAKTDWF